MSDHTMLSSARSSKFGRSAPSASLSAWFAVALGAAALGYLVHHLPPLREHAAETVAVALLAAGAAAWGLGTLLAGARRVDLPLVLVPSPGGAQTRPLAREDLDFCAVLHAEALAHGFFGQLGPRFLRAYYATFLDSPHAIAFAATVAGQPVGALVGILRPRAHARWVLRRRGPALALLGVGGMVLRPRAAFRFLRTRIARYARMWRRHRGAAAPTGPSPGGEPAVLSHVTVAPGARGVGVGRLLVRTFEHEAQRAGAERAFLTTLEGPEGAGGFYAELGWVRCATHTTPDGRRVEQWARNLEEAPL
jgi:ribosomal protein S18 acetylase RimI-like enzyme